MEINVTKATMITNETGRENSLCFEFPRNYFKIARHNENKILQFEVNKKTFEIPINKLSTKKDKRWIKFDMKNCKLSAYFFYKENERKIAKDIIYEITGIENYDEPIIFTWNFNMEDNKKIDYLLNVFYDTV